MAAFILLLSFCVALFYADAIILTADYHENTVANAWNPNNRLMKFPVTALHCNYKTDCVVNCYGSLACHHTVIVGPTSAQLTVNCHSDKYHDTDEGLACQGITINAQDSTQLILNVYNENGELSLATIHTPTHTIFTPNTFILCGIVDTYNVQSFPRGTDTSLTVCGASNTVYSIYGFKAVAWTYYRLNSWALYQCGVDTENCGSLITGNQMICGSNYQYANAACNPVTVSDGYFNCKFSLFVTDPCYYADTYPPTAKPTPSPTPKPTGNPTDRPTDIPTASPSSVPSVQPSIIPSVSPSAQPTAQPSVRPSAQPTAQPSIGPSAGPSVSPSAQSSAIPSAQPSAHPSVGPLVGPSVTPSSPPTTEKPTSDPVTKPSTSSTSTSSTETTPTAAPEKEPTSSPTMNPTKAPTQEEDTCDEDGSLDRSDCNELDNEPSDQCSILITMVFDVCYVEPYRAQRDILWTNTKQCVCQDIYAGSAYDDDDMEKECHIEMYQSTSMTDVYVAYGKQNSNSDHSNCEAQHMFEISVSLYNMDCDYVHNVARWLLNQGDGLIIKLDDCNLGLSTQRNYLYPSGFGRISKSEIEIKFRDENGDSKEVKNLASLKSLSVTALMMHCMVLVYHML